MQNFVLGVSTARRVVLLRPEGPKAGMGFFGGDSQPPPHQLEDLGSDESSSTGVRGGAPASKRFCLYSNAPDSFFCNSIWVDTLLICVTKVPTKHT